MFALMVAEEPSGGLLDWIFGRFNELFGWLFSLGMGGELDWVAQDWLNFVLVIVIFGILMDGVIYFVRYRPYSKWKKMIENVVSRLTSRRPARPFAAVRAASAGAADKPPEAADPHRAEPRTAPRREVPATRPAAPAAPISVTRPVVPQAPVSEATGIYRLPLSKAGPARQVPAAPAERFQPAPPREAYDAEPTTIEPR